MTVQTINTIISPSVQPEATSNVPTEQGEQFSEVIQQANADKSDKSMSGNDASASANNEAHASVRNEKNKNQSTDEDDVRDKEAAENTELLSSLATQLILSNFPKPIPEVKPETLAQKSNANTNANNATAKSIQNSQSIPLQKMPITDIKNGQVMNDSAQILANQAVIDAKQMTSVGISQSSAQAWQVAQAAALAKMENLAQPTMTKTDSQKVVLPELKQIKDDKQPLEAKIAHMPLDKINQQASPLSQNNKNEMQIADAQPTQNFQAVFAKENTVPMNDKQTKTAQAVSEVGNLIQAQISAALSDRQQVTNNQDLANKPEVIDTTQMKKYDYEMTVALSKDPIDSTIKESYATNIKIYPPDLGSVLAKLKVDKNSTQLVLVTENDRVKSIVEANLPQLREHFQQSNLTLTHVEVQTASTGSGDQFSGKQQDNGELMDNSREANTPTQAQAPTDPQKNPNKIIDTYA